LIQYHGWSDPQITPLHSVQYYNSVVEALGDRAHGSYRLFMAPGMGHCGGGSGPNKFDAFGALVEWVEKSKAPDRIIASRPLDGTAVRTRPLCPDPQVAVYKKTGSTDDAANFVCKAP
jgi:feruloyl esterase